MKFSFKTVRTHRGLTLDEAAKHIGISAATLSNYENGVTSPNLETILKMASVYKWCPTMMYFSKEDQIRKEY